MDETPKGWFISLIQADPLEEIGKDRKAKRDRAERDEEQRRYKTRLSLVCIWLLSSNLCNKMNDKLLEGSLLTQHYATPTLSNPIATSAVLLCFQPVKLGLSHTRLFLQ